MINNVVLFPSLRWTVGYYLCRGHINILAEAKPRSISMCPRPNNRQQSTVNWGIKSLSHNLAYSNCLLYAAINVVTSRIIHHTFLPIPKHNKLYHYSSVYIVRLQRAVLGSHHCRVLLPRCAEAQCRRDHGHGKVWCSATAGLQT